MWFNIKAQLKSMEEFADRNARRANELDVELQEARNELIQLRKKLAERDAEEGMCSFEFDFKAVKAFSIERNIHEGRPVTIIGYLVPTEEVKDGVITNTDKIREWYLYCNVHKHEALVQAFREARR